MKRDFSNSTGQRLLSGMAAVESGASSEFTSWSGDGWSGYSDLISDLGLQSAVQNVNAYHASVVQKNNSARQNTAEIFNAVQALDSTYTGCFTGVQASLQKCRSYVESMKQVITPGAGKFTAQNVRSVLSGAHDELEREKVAVYKSLYEKDIGGELVFDEELLKEALRLDPAKMTDARKQAVLAVLADLKNEADTVCSTLLALGGDSQGADFLTLQGYADNDGKYVLLTGASVHNEQLYMNLLNYMESAGKNKATMAASLISMGSGDVGLSLLGAEGDAEIKGLFSGSASFAAYLAKYESEHVKAYAAKTDAEAKIKLDSNYSDSKDVHKKTKEDFSVLYDPKTGAITLNDVPKYAKKKATLAEIGVNVSASVSALDYTLSGDGSFWGLDAKGSVNAKIAEAEAHASLSGGMYVMDKDGNNVFAPGVDAKIGASFTALSADASGTIGSGPVQGYGEIKAAVGKIGADASAVASIFDEDGDLNVQAHVKGEIEAIAAELEAEGGVKVCGADIGVKGSVNVGVGAHADIGIIDGHLKFDVGASLGVGFSVGLDVDLAGLWDGITSGVSSFFEL